MNKYDSLIEELNQLFVGGKPPIKTNSDKKRKLVLFIHGWSGSDDYRTWGNFLTLFENDPQLQRNYIYKTYKYKAPKISFDFFKKLIGKKTPNIFELAEGLRTTIDYNYDDYDKITLCCHSLGGLVAMRYLILLRKECVSHKIDRLIMFATPIQGSDLANVGKFLSGQIKQMCKDSVFLRILNEDWSNLSITSDVDTYYYIGDQDKVVDITFAKQRLNQMNIQFRIIPNCDHISIVKPEHKEDLSYAILKNILTAEK